MTAVEVAQKTTPLKPQPRKVEMGNLVGRGLATAQGKPENSATHLQSKASDVAIGKVFLTQTNEVLRGAGVLRLPHDAESMMVAQRVKFEQVPLLKRIHQEAAAAALAEVAAGGRATPERPERGETPGLPRRGIGLDGTLRRRGHRATQRGQEQRGRMAKHGNPFLAASEPARMSQPTEAVSKSAMYFDAASKTCIVPPFEKARSGQGRLSPAARLDAPPERGEMGRGPWKKWTPPYRTHHDLKRPWQHQPADDQGGQRAGRQASDSAVGWPIAVHQGASEGTDASAQRLCRPASVHEHRMGDTWFKDSDHRQAASYFDTPLWSRAKEGVETPYWMQPKTMNETSTFHFPLQEASAATRRPGTDLNMTVPSTGSTDSQIHPRLMRSLDNKELRHFLARAGVWSVEPLSTCPRPELLGLARQHMSQIREIKKSCAYHDCKRLGKPGSVTDKYRVALQKSDTVGSLYQGKQTTSVEPTAQAAPEADELIREVENAQMELEKSIEAVCVCVCVCV